MNAEAFIQSIDGASPSGVELRYTSEFLQIENLLEPAARANRIDSNGDMNHAATVDWTKVLADAERLAATGRDLKLLVIVARVWSNQNGFSGVAAGCELISDALTAHWDSIHPELRDRPDPVAAARGRANCIADLENRDAGLLGDLNMNVLLQPRGLDAVRGSELAQAALSDYEYMQIGTGGMSAAERAERSAAHASLQKRVQTAILATSEETPEILSALIAQIGAANAARAALEAAYSKAGGFQNGGGIRLSGLETFLLRCLKALELHAGTEHGATQQSEGEVMTNISEPNVVPAAGVASSAGAMPGQLASRREVEKCLDLIIEFYERTEPSSPIPHLASRMRRMVPMDFLQLIEEVAPGGLKDFKNVAGVDDKRKNEQ